MIWMVVLVGVWLAAAAVQAFLLALQTHEHRRFARSRLKNARTEPMTSRVALIAPCKGLDLGMVDNLRPLLRQDYPNYEVVFVVESADDDACETIRRLISESHSVPVRMLVSGKASDTGQKIHNLLTATADLGDDVEILAFVDSDARPHAAWLRLLVQRLDRPEAVAATGYRWFFPANNTLGTLLQYSINACAAVLYRSDARGLVWGGSWAIRRDKFELCGLRDAWRGTLSDDLVASRVLRSRRMRVEFEPACMLASPLAVDFGQMFEFLRRQYVIGRCYAPRNWCLGFAAIVSSAADFWLTLLAAVYAAATGAWWTWWAVGFCVLWYAANVARGLMRRAVAKVYYPERMHELDRACRWDIWGVPITSAVNAAAMLAAAMGHRITWRGITYRLYQGGRIEILSRDGDAAVRHEHLRIDAPQANSIAHSRVQMKTETRISPSGRKA